MPRRLARMGSWEVRRRRQDWWLKLKWGWPVSLAFLFPQELLGLAGAMVLRSEHAWKAPDIAERLSSGDLNKRMRLKR